MDVRHRLFTAAVLCGATFVLANCAKNGSTDAGTDLGSTFATPSGTTPLTNTGTIDTVKQTDAVKDAVGKFEPEDDAQADAKAKAQKALQGLSGAYGSYPIGSPFSGASAFIQRLLQEKEELKKAADAARQAQAEWLARLLEDIAAKQDVHRFYHPTANRHFFSLSGSEGVNAGFRYEGVGFRTYKQPNAEYQVALYRCYVPSAFDHFVSLDAACEGQTFEGSYGFISAQQRNGAPLPLGRLYIALGDHLVTLSQEEITAITVPGGWTLEAYLGYPPQ